MDPTSTDLKRNGTQPFVTLQKHLHFSWCGSATDGYRQIAHLETTINAEKYVQVSEQHTLPVQTLLSGKVFQDFKKTRRVRVLNWPSICILHSANMTRA